MKSVINVDDLSDMRVSDPPKLAESWLSHCEYWLIRTKKKVWAKCGGAVVRLAVIWALSWQFIPQIAAAQDADAMTFEATVFTPDIGVKPVPLQELTAAVQIDILSGEPELMVSLDWRAKGPFESNGESFRVCDDFVVRMATTCTSSLPEERFDLFANIDAVIPVQTLDEYEVYLHLDFPSLLPMNSQYTYTLPMTWGTLFQTSARGNGLVAYFSGTQARSIWLAGFNVNAIFLIEFSFVVQPQS